MTATDASAIPMTTASEEERLIVEGLLDFAEKSVLPREEALAELLHDPRKGFTEDGREHPAITAARRETRVESGRAGYYAMFCPEEMGGGGLGARLSFLCWEALHHVHGPGERFVYNSISHWASGPSRLWTRTSDEVASDVRPAVVSGELQGCFGMSEPDAGSDAWRMKTTARRDGDDWVLNGSKQWTSFSPTADYILAFAVTDPAKTEARKGGITCFYFPTSTPGFNVESVIKMFGEIGGREGILSLTDVRVPDAWRVGDLDRGFDLAMMGATSGRFYNAARSVGLSRWALECAVSYAKTRWASGKPIAEHQAIQLMLADSATEIYAARSMGLDCATRADAGQDTRREAAMAKLFATNTAVRVFDRAIQVHGGMGVTNELRLHEGWKTVRTLRIADGTDEILKRTITRELLKGNLGF
ncbi:MAG: acyl-CoA dehydrogenase family protein [Dehalococcoidia bacterium]